MAQKGLLTSAQPLTMEDYNKLIDGLHKDRFFQWEIICVVAFSLALRISDVKRVTWAQILKKDFLNIEEKKTEKNRKIPMNQSVINKIQELYTLIGSPDENLSIITNPRTQLPYSTWYINNRLKIFRVRYRLRIKAFSTHTFRKTFGRFVYEKSGKTEESIILLNRIFKHSSLEITMRYLGLQEEEINSVFGLIEIK